MRVLSAILFADIQGYSALMGKDEKLASQYRNKFKSTLEALVGEFEGKIIQFYGDGALIIFTSGLNAVEYSVKVQKELQAEPTVPVRIGIHMGDVVIEEEGVFGDSVNVTSRIESIAVPGSIFVSDKIHDAIANHLHIQTKSLGRQSFKNVLKEIEVFAVVNEGVVNPGGISKDGKLAEKEKGSKLKYILPAAAVIIVIVLAAVFFYPKDKNKRDEKTVTLTAGDIRKPLSAYLEQLYSTKVQGGDSSIRFSEKYIFSGGEDKYNPLSAQYKPATFRGIIKDTMNNDIYNCMFAAAGSGDSVVSILNAQVTGNNKIRILNIQLNNVIHTAKDEQETKKEAVEKDKTDENITKEDVKTFLDNKPRLKKKLLSKNRK